MRRLPSAGVSRQVRAIGVAVLLAASSHALALGQSQVLIPSRNVNVISGTGPHGDWTLQRQNEPSMACSSRNPLNCFAVANDYRTVDIPFPQDDGRVIGDAWLGWYWTKNGGQSWRTRLLPGYPQDTSAIGQTSPLYINQYQAGADPVVRAGANGMFFYSGIAFRRGPGGGSTVFVARFIDNNNNENPDVPSIAYLDTTRIMSAPNGTVKNFFIDKPWIAVDIPRGSQTCNIGGGTTGVPLQPLPCSRVYVGFTVFQGPNEERGTVMLAVSEDSGRTWSKPQPVTPLDADVNNDGAVDNKDIQTWAKANRSVCQTPEYVWDADINVDCVVDSRDTVLITKNLQQKSVTVPTVPPVHQGVALGIVPSTGALRIAWRQFRTTSSPRPDEIQASISTDGGQTFAPPVTVSPLIPFDQRTTETTFRSNAFPTLAIDGDGRSYLAWTTRGIAKSGITGDSRIVLSTSMNGLAWSPPVPIDDSVLPGHQIMPSLSFASGRLQLVYYDEREDVSGVFENDIDEQDVLHTRHTTDVRVAQATAGPSPVFESVRVSDYAFGVLPGSDDVRQLEFDPPNLPIFRLGQAPFKGDYIDIVPSQSIVPNGTGWSFNTAPGTSPVFHAVWTDNRDVRPPANGDWTRYTPPVPSSFARPTTSGFNPGEVLPACEPGFVATRNQNVYTSRITNGLFAAALGNAKPLGGIQRAFATYVQNGTSARRSYRMSINAPPDVTASFNQFQSLLSLDVSVPARSTIARTVYVSGVNAQSSAVIVLVTEILNGAPVPGGQTTRIVLNPDSTNPDVDNPDVDNPDVDNPDVDNPDVDNPDVDNAEVYNPDVDNGVVVGQSNPDVDNPDVDNPDVDNVVVENPSILATGVSNPDVDNPDVDNPDVDNPDVDNADLTNGALSDTTWQVSNFGNTSATYSVKMLLRRPLPEGFRSQLLVYRVYKTPVALGCSLKTETANVLIINMPDPPFFNAIAPTTNTAGAVTQSLASTLTRTRPLRRVSATGEPQLVAAAPNDIDPSDPNAEDVTVAIAPGESLRVTLRIFDPDRFDAVTYSPVTAVTPALAAHSLDTATAETNPGAAPEISVALITTESLPAATQKSYLASLQAIVTGQWSVVGGALPTGLTLSSATGVISGTATVAANEVKFTVRFVGGDGAVDFKEFTIAVVATAAASADVSVSFTSAPATAITGLPINYVMSVTNNSATMAAANVAIEQELPVGATFGSATPGCIYTTRVRCVLGALAPGGNVIIAVTATLSGAGPVVSKATVTTDTAESVILNNEQTAATNVQAYAACTAPTFSGPTLFPTNQFGGFQSVLGEVTGDAYKDIVLSSVTSPNVLILPARTDQIGLFGAPLTLPLSEAPQGVAVADLDKNGQNDIVVSANVGTYALFLRGLGGGAFASEVQIPLGDAAFVIDAADFNNDGNLDLVVGTDNGKLKTLTGDGFGGFGPPTTVHSGSQTLQFVIADYNNDGLLDLAASDRGTGDILLFQNTPGAPGTFSQQWSVNHGVGARARKVGDLNGDGLPDLEVTVSDFPTAQTLIYLSTGVGGFTGPLDANAGPAGIQPTAGDVTGDGIPDLVTASGAWGSIAVQAGIGDGTFAPPIHLAAKTFDIPKVMDINGDHRDDIVAVGGSPGFVQAFYNNCSSTTTDLRITTRSDTPDPVNAGALLTYQTTIANVSATTATGVVTNFALGGFTNATEAQSATSPQGSCAVVAKDHVRCSIASLPPSASATIQVTARSYAGGSSTLTMTSVTANQADSVPSDNWALMTTNVIAVPVTLTVTSTADDGVGSLRNAIRLANANASGATINFNIPGAGPHTITPVTALEAITKPVFIDGETQSGYILGVTGPQVILDGANVASVSAGITLSFINGGSTSAGSTVNGLGLVNWKAAGLRISVNENTPEYTINHNSIGVDPSGTIPGPNAIGIEVGNSANVLIGDNVLGDGNTIAFNTGAGIAVTGNARVSILPNRIYQNGGLGIDLGNNGVTTNDANDADSGPNTLQNFPIIATATTDGDTTQVTGSIHTTPNLIGLPIQFFFSNSCDASGNGEGDLFVDSAIVSTNGAGNFNFAITLFVDGTSKFVTATAGVFSSEFSNCVAITNTP